MMVTHCEETFSCSLSSCGISSTHSSSPAAMACRYTARRVESLKRPRPAVRWAAPVTSDVDDHLGQPAATATLHLESVAGPGLDLVIDAVAAGIERLSAH